MNKKSLTEKNKISITSFSIFAEIIAFPPALLLLSQILFWCYRNSKNSKPIWFYMSVDQWCEQLRIKRPAFRRAIKLLIALGFVDVKRTSKKFPAWYRINQMAVATYLIKQHGYKLAAPTIKNIFTALSADKNNLLLTAENLNITKDSMQALYYSSLELIAKKMLSDNPSATPHMFTQSAKKIKALTGLSKKQQFIYMKKSEALLQIKTIYHIGKKLSFQVLSCHSSIAQLEHISASIESEKRSQSASLESEKRSQSASLESKKRSQSASLESEKRSQSAPLTYNEEKTYKDINILKIFKKAGLPSNSNHMIGSVGQPASEFNITGSPAIKFDDQDNKSGYLSNSSKHVNHENEQQASDFNITGSPAIEFYDQANDLNFSESLTEQQTESESDYLTGSPTGPPSPEFDFELDYTGSKRITQRPTPPPFDDQFVDFNITGKKIAPHTVEQPVVIGSVSPPAQEQPVICSGSDSPSEQFDPLLDSPMFPFFWLKFAAPLISPLFSLLEHGSGSNDQSKNSGSPPP